jgi:hypothetical protein
VFLGSWYSCRIADCLGSFCRHVGSRVLGGRGGGSPHSGHLQPLSIGFGSCCCGTERGSHVAGCVVVLSWGSRRVEEVCAVHYDWLWSE